MSLLAASAVLQLAAAGQRWLIDGDAPLPPISIEDHLFDYTVPADPWHSVGSAALLFGIGSVVLGAGLVALVVILAPRTRRGATVAAAVVVTVAAAVALPPTVFGVHAMISGLQGTPSALTAGLTGGGGTALHLLSLTGLAVMLAWALRRSRAWSAAVALLFGTTVLGHLLAGFVIAPMLVGYTSHDTTPWTEAIPALCVAAAAVMTWLAGSAQQRQPTAVPTVSTPSI